ncbi:MAG TPA: alpha/beta fold hydrolase [Propionicimonas sp.]|uniref:alpha/beta hydrolase n=1 Tax=Propionicimonas sp. TaxID=1955623 RepID=UPI002F42FE45
MQVSDFAQPFHADGGRVGVLFCHGFTGSPWSLLEWAKVTAGAGYRVSLPRLPGHGTSWQELNVTEWRDWYGAAEHAFLELRANCDTVFIAGLSMGCALALRLAERYPDQVAGLALVNPAVLGFPKMRALPVLHHLRASAKSIGSDIAEPGIQEQAYARTPLKAANSMMRMWVDVRACLDLVHCPLLVFRSATDHVVPAASTAFVLSHVSSDVITERILERSYHVATMDRDKEQIFTESLQFFAEHSGTTGSPGAAPQG